MSFRYREGYLYCEGLQVKTICEEVERTPFYLYSAQELRKSFAAYSDGLNDLPAVISFAVKANGNLHILATFQKLGCWATLVSEGELRLALAAGFNPQQTVFNGNGKTNQELSIAIDHGCLINIDSEFDLDHIHKTAEKRNQKVNGLLRINPDIDPEVHPYISTGIKNSKFGLSSTEIPSILASIDRFQTVNLVGLHCHLGSTISNLDVFSETMDVMTRAYNHIRERGYPLKYLNLGGGLGIDYHRENDQFPLPGDLVDVLKDRIPEDATLILEPGRSLVGPSGVLICKVIGVKRGDERKFIVTDGSMTELLRPSLYSAFHRIQFTEPVIGSPEIFDIVGPVCESTDFLGKDRELPSPPEGTGIVVFDVGAYGYAMSSNYNARTRPPEYLVDGVRLSLIRRGEKFEDQMRLFQF